MGLKSSHNSCPCSTRNCVHCSLWNPAATFLQNGRKWHPLSHWWIALPIFRQKNIWFTCFTDILYVNTTSEFYMQTIVKCRHIFIFIFFIFLLCVFIHYNWNKGFVVIKVILSGVSCSLTYFYLIRDDIFFFFWTFSRLISKSHENMSSFRNRIKNSNKNWWVFSICILFLHVTFTVNKSSICKFSESFIFIIYLFLYISSLTLATSALITSSVISLHLPSHTCIYK